MNVDSKHIHKVLIGSAGTGAAYAATVSLRKYWHNRCEIHLFDINPRGLVSSASLADFFYQCPRSADDEFWGFLEKTILTTGINTYLPLIPAEISLAQKKMGCLEQMGVNTILASKYSPCDLSDKWSVYQMCETKGIPCPLTTIGSLPDNSADFFVKPRFGFGSIGAKLVSKHCDNFHELMEKDLIFQTVCVKPEFTIDAFSCAQNDFVFAVVRERLEVKAGVCVKARVFRDSRLEKMARDLASSFELRGTFCFQVMMQNEQMVLTDLNPRPGAGTSMSQAYGVDFFAANFALAWHEDFLTYLPDIDDTVYVTRQYIDLVQRSLS